jgi:predicted nucleic acid-binding protein
LILYARIGRLHLLKALFDEILIPPAVWREVVVDAGARIGAREVRQSAWIRQRPLPSEPMPPRFAALDVGEAEALALASTLKPEIPILLHDDQARRIAQEVGVFVIDSAGILVRAKEADLIPMVRPVLLELRTAGLFLGKAADRELLEAVGEG